MYRIGWIINPFRKRRHCCTEQLRFVGGICGTWCVRGSGSGRDRWPRPALPGVSRSAAIPCTRWKPAFGQKGAFISTRLSQSASRNEKHWKNRQAGLWEPSPEGSRLLFVFQLLAERSGWHVGLGNRQLQYSAPPFLGQGKAQECCFTRNQHPLLSS